MPGKRKTTKKTSKAKSANGKKGSKKAAPKSKALTELEMEKYLAKQESLFIEDSDPDEGINDAESDIFVQVDHTIAAVGYDSDNDDRIIRDHATSESSPEMPNGLEEYDSDGFQDEGFEELRKKYFAQQHVMSSR